MCLFMASSGYIVCRDYRKLDINICRNAQIAQARLIENKVQLYTKQVEYRSSELADK